MRLLLPRPLLLLLLPLLLLPLLLLLLLLLLQDLRTLALPLLLHLLVVDDRRRHGREATHEAARTDGAGRNSGRLPAAEDWAGGVHRDVARVLGVGVLAAKKRS